MFDKKYYFYCEIINKETKEVISRESGMAVAKFFHKPEKVIAETELRILQAFQIRKGLSELKKDIEFVGSNPTKKQIEKRISSVEERVSDRGKFEIISVSFNRIK